LFILHPSSFILSDKELCMAEDRFESREINYRQWLPWTHLFRGFWVALDFKKLLLAAAGIFVMACGWWLLATIFLHSRSKPVWPTDFPAQNYKSERITTEQEADLAAWTDFKRHRNSWNLLYEAAGPGPGRTVSGDDGYTDAADLASSPEEFSRIKEVDGSAHVYDVGGTRVQAGPKPHGKLSTWPWFEDRGPNQALLLAGRAGQTDEEGVARHVPWERGHFVDWFVGEQVPVLIEPLVKFLRPVVYLLHPNALGWDTLYFLLVVLWTLATWAIFGGAITRIAAVQLARNEKIGMVEALRFTLARWRSYLFASFAPLVGLAFIAVALLLFGIGNLIPWFAEVWDGLLWFVPLGLGLLMAFVLVGLIGWPMIHATLSTEGSDSFDALSRSYSYVYQKPWNYLWYALVALAYGALVVFFVGLMGSLTIYLARWGVSLTPGSSRFHRDPAYLFVYAPTSFGWRELLLQGSPVVKSGSAVTQQVIDSYVSSPEFHGWNHIGALLVAFWLGLVFLLIIGFGYSYFWSAGTIMYLLMRRKVDDTDLDEVYLEEEELEEPYGPPATGGPATPPPPASGAPQVQMVEAPTLRPSAPPAAAPPAPAGSEGTAPNPGDGNVATGEGAS
jgi:hypothetical protein